jgi:hypothetical protein
VGNNEIGDDKNVGESLAISVVMQTRRYEAGRIAR